MNELQGSVRGRRLVASALLVILVLMLISRTARLRPIVSPVERFLADALSPLQSLVQRMTSPLGGISREIGRLSSMREENLMMRDKVLQIPWLETDLLEARQENARLRELLRFAQTLPQPYVPAMIIGRNPDNWLSTATIDKGSNEGLSTDDVVVTAAGLVGRLTKTSSRTSTVMLMTDPDSGVGCMSQRSRDAGVLVGQIGTRLLRMKIFSRDADIKVGDVIITSGLGSHYPKGLPIGKVMSVGKGEYGLAKTAEVAPFVNFDRLEEVLVMKYTEADLESVDR